MFNMTDEQVEEKRLEAERKAIEDAEREAKAKQKLIR